jgi:hypothetical protein
MAHADLSDHAGASQRCACGQEARYAGRRRKDVETVLGGLSLQRAYYHCPACGSGFCPRDETLGLTESSLSPGVPPVAGTLAPRSARHPAAVAGDGRSRRDISHSISQP